MQTVQSFSGRCCLHQVHLHINCIHWRIRIIQAFLLLHSLLNSSVYSWIKYANLHPHSLNFAELPKRQDSSWQLATWIASPSVLSGHRHTLRDKNNYNGIKHCLNGNFIPFLSIYSISFHYPYDPPSSIFTYELLFFRGGNCLLASFLILYLRATLCHSHCIRISSSAFRSPTVRSAFGLCPTDSPRDRPAPTLCTFATIILNSGGA